MVERGLRRANLQRVLISRFEGNKSALARKVGKKPSYITELLSGDRSFGEKMARHIEANIPLPRRALDEPLGAEGAESAYAVGWPFSIDQARYARLAASQRAQIERLLVAMIEDFEKVPARPKPQRKAG